MHIADSARRHSIADADMLHALRNIVGEVTHRRRDDFRVWIGRDRAGRALEGGLLDVDNERLIIHAMRLRRNWRRFIGEETS